MREDEERRKEHIARLREAGVDPYPHKFTTTHSIKDTIESNKDDITTTGTVSLAGRVMAKRLHGKLSFIDLLDDGSRIQCSFRKNVLEDDYHRFKDDIDRGDFIGLTGTLFFSNTGQLTLNAESFVLLAKGLYDLPHSHFGIENFELRYRNRPLDCVINEEVRQRFRHRAEIISSIRRHLGEIGFLEVETRYLQPVYSGANAHPFTTRVLDLDQEWFLRISPELELKDYIIAGFANVFEIGKDFRNESVDSTHNPEFTMMELYSAYADYNDIRMLTENLVAHVAQEVFGTLEFEFRGKKIDLSPPWKTITMKDSLREFAGIEVDSLDDGEIQSILEENDLQIEGGYNRGLAIAELFDIYVQDKLIQPTFVTDYPKETTTLCKLHREDKELIERFELFIGAMECANAYTELNDPVLQESFFIEADKRRRKGDSEIPPFDPDFLEAMKYGMPPTGGLGLGIDRLVMLLTGADSIKEVIFFPMMRRINDKQEEDPEP